jgi:micrococcal nuclease
MRQRQATVGFAFALTFGAGATLGAVVVSGVARPQAAAVSGAPSTDEAAVIAPTPVRPRDLSYPAELLQVVDGDTFVARVRIWPGLDTTTKVRLRGIDAPETRARCAEEQALANTARDTLAAILAQGEIGIAKVGLDKYGGRVLAAASTRQTADVGAAMLAAGVARPYEGGRRETWCGLARN